MKRSEVLVGEGWDVMIVLDALRYDYFVELHRYFLDGHLEELWSSGSCTVEWFRNTFRDKMPEITYFSANPFINSFDDDLRCRAREKFGRVIDAWLQVWDDDLGTVPPLSLNKLVESYGLGERTIIHYLQPHSPYLTPEGFVYGFPRPRKGRSVLHGISMEKGPVVRAGMKALSVLGTILEGVGVPNGYYLKLIELMRLPPLSPLDATRRRFGVEGLRRAYRDNVMVVLDASTRLIEKFVESGLQVVVTSDHGELLGEDNMFSHPCGSNNRILKKVPLLKVRSVKGSRPDLARVAYSAKVAAIREKVLRSDVLNASTG